MRIAAILMAALVPTFMTSLDSTVVTMALPQIRAELALGGADLKWVAAVYPLTLASALLLGGHLADSVGRRATLLLGVALFTTASAGCSTATQAGTLIAFRGVQGAGAALVLPASLAVLAHDLPPRARNAGFSAATATMATALACGPVLSGVVTQHLGWAWLFAMNTPLGLTSLLVIALAVPRCARGSRTPQSLLSTVSIRAVVLASLCLASVTYGLIEGPESGFTGFSFVICGVAAVVSAAGLGCELKLHRSIALGVLLRQRCFAGGIITQLLWGLGVTGVYFFTSQFLQNNLGLRPTSAGLAFTPVALSVLAVAPFTARVVRRFGGGRVCCTGLLLVALGLLLVALGSTSGSFVRILPGLSAVGFGSALAVPLTARALESPPRHLSGIAAGLFSAAREASGVFGIAFVGAIVTFVQHAAATAGSAPAGAFLCGYRAGLCVASALVAAGAPVAVWALRPPTDPRGSDAPSLARGGEDAR
ncbi:MFS transporter [Streptacidiphilus anmyonensis]|uniref:MFS transporter n=1 Tax=Streptacidiphilus anmyonensis TaxID=405782 RepID=UPI0006944E6B|nr:MFS transporter [Streptacidiphilus anmyonensis]